MKHKTCNLRNKKPCIIKMFQVSSFKFQERGFTIIEMVFYTAIVGIIGSVLTLFLLNSLKAYNKTQAIQHVFNNVNGSLRTITDEIKYARSIYTPTTILNSDSGQLSLETALNAPVGEPTTFADFYLDNGRIYEKREGSAAVALTSERVFITALRFSSVSNNGKVSAIAQITGRINTASTKPEDQAQLTLSSSAALRGAY